MSFKKKNKLLKIIFLCFIALVFMFAFILYTTIKTKSTRLDKIAPFDGVLNRVLTVKQDVYVMKEMSVIDDNFPYVLIDTGHRNYQWYIDRTKLSVPDLELIDSIPAGAIIRFQKAVNYTNGVSGSSIAYLFGTLSYEEKAYKLGYAWGDESFSRRLDGHQNTWYFDLAPWQTVRDTNYYVVPKARWW